MNLQRIWFLGTRTANFDATSAFFGDVLGLGVGHAEPGWSVFQLPSGQSDFVEVFGQEHDNASLFPAEVREGLMVAFAVDDLAGARAEFAAANVELIGEIVWAKPTVRRPEHGWFRLVLLPRARRKRLRAATGRGVRGLTAPSAAPSRTGRFEKVHR